MVIGITQHMVFVSRTQLLDQDNVEFIVDDNVVKNIGHFEGVIETTGSTVVNLFIGMKILIL